MLWVKCLKNSATMTERDIAKCKIGKITCGFSCFTTPPRLLVTITKKTFENKFRKGRNALDPFPDKPWFLRVCSIRLLKTVWENEKLLATSNFSFSCSVFYPFEELSAIFIKFEIVGCKPKFVVWERVIDHNKEDF